MTVRWNEKGLSADDIYRRKRQALITEAGRCFGVHGFHGTSLEDVATRLNVTKAALYYYVKSKKEILFECHNLALDLGDEALVKAEQEGENGLDTLKIFIRFYIELLTGEMGSCAVLTDIQSMAPRDMKKIIKRRDQFDKQLRSIIQRGIDDGSIAPCDVKLAGFCVMGAVNWIPRWFSDDGSRSGSDIAENFTTFLTSGLAQK